MVTGDLKNLLAEHNVFQGRWYNMTNWESDGKVSMVVRNNAWEDTQYGCREVWLTESGVDN